MEKRDNRLQTGSGGGKKCKYDDSDEMILKIIGKDSPAIDGLQIPESSGSNETKVYVPVFIAETPPSRPQNQIRRKSDHARQSALSPKIIALGNGLHPLSHVCATEEHLITLAS
ncbi:unnamed protein product [Arctia plantaginis]|uniref:Uncharacterized protein n=1 Tax=Arctia plantaginis TaxID=874455 RepID=A0A8S1BIL2_ARCPL|nr:unnamed protein product [Arctia plantaginis]